MMKNVCLLIPCALLTICSVGATASAKTRINYFKCTPFFLNGDKTIMTFDVNASEALPLNIEIYIINPLYPDGTLLTKTKITSSKVLNYNYDNKYTYASENKVKVSYSVGKEKKKSFSHAIEVSNGSFYTLNDSVFDYSTTSKNYFYSGDSANWTLNSERYTFYNFENTYVPNYYHKINISDFYLKANSTFQNKISYGNALFAITNREHAFDGFNHDETFAYIPLCLTKKGDDYVLSFDRDLYVDPFTLQMSPVQEDGFVKTDYLYFPRDKKRFENEYQCMITINNLGIDKATFVSYFKYKSLLNIFGDCRNSEFCIVNYD